jgi:hypothetical protein
MMGEFFSEDMADIPPSWPHHRHFYKGHADDSPIAVGIFQTSIQQVIV